MFDPARNYGITARRLHHERIAASDAIDVQLPRPARRLRDRIGDAACIIIIAGLALAALVALP